MDVLPAPDIDGYEGCAAAVPAGGAVTARAVLPAPENNADYIADRAFAWGP